MIDGIPEPVSRREMRTTKFVGNSTICQTLRDIYAITKRKRIKTKCRIAMAMAKAMDNKLQEYKMIMDLTNGIRRSNE